MKTENTIFADPNGKFEIVIPEKWKYVKPGNNNVYPCQFEISPDDTFQISCRPINDHIVELIADNDFKTYDFSLPNLSFYEFYKPEKKLISYIWMQPIDDHFIMAMYIYDPLKVDTKNLGLLLMEIRMSLQNLKFNRNEADEQKSPRSQPKISTANHNLDYYSISSWNHRSGKFFDWMTKKDKPQLPMIAPLDVDPLKLYALLKSFVSNQPNGFYTMVRGGKPLDGIFWWDFLLESDKGFIHIWRTPYILEAMYKFDDGDFDLIKFCEKNINENIKSVLKEIDSFEKHTVYINHYKSYKECVRYLWEEILKIDLTPPVSPAKHLVNDKSDLDAFKEGMQKFSNNSVKFHTLGKSLVLNAAFEIESFLNLTIRIGSAGELNMYPEVLERLLRGDFMYRLRNMTYYSNIILSKIDTKHQAIKDANELMILRNKYVHFEEDEAHNKLGEIPFDNDFPLHPISKDRPGIEAIRQVFHKPDFNTVKKAQETSANFVAYMISLFHPSYREEISTLLEQNPISYNETRGVYSSVYTTVAMDFFNQ